MSIIATLPVFFLSNSFALNRLLEKDYSPGYGTSQLGEDVWKSWVGTASLFRDASRPGHVFNQRWEKYRGASGLGLLAALDCVGEEYLKVVNRRLYVRDHAVFARWQNLRSRMSTLPVKCRVLYRNKLPLVNELAHPLSPSMADYITHAGLNETHLHLFACELPEQSWLTDLRHIDQFYLQEVRNWKQHQALYEGIHPDLTPHRLVSRMKLAAVLRGYLLGTHGEYTGQELLDLMRSAYVELVNHTDENALMSGCAFMARGDFYSIEQEMRLWERIFEWEAKGAPHTQSIMFYAHLYLLIQNEYLHLKRQQEERNGFDAFSRVSRHKSLYRKEYLHDTFARILSSSESTGDSVVEIRVQPRTLCAEGYLITEAWREALKRLRKGYPKLVIVAHFVKKQGITAIKNMAAQLADKYAAVRLDMERDCKLLASYALYLSQQEDISIGIDAAGDELLMPPESLAPVFRRFERECGISHKTFHCGEDFLHLIGGIRAVHDAVSFLQLGEGNRVGHATAIGISPSLWKQKMPDVLVLKKGEWLLDLIFAWRLLQPLRLEHAVDLEHQLMPLANAVFEHAVDFGLNMQNLLAFYDARHLHPSKVRSVLSADCRLEESHDSEVQLVIDFLKKRGECGLRLLCHWHYNTKSRSVQEEEVEVPLNILDDATLVLLQQQVQRLIKKRNVVIETLPVSNVRISQYQDMRQHHLLRWLKVEGCYFEGDEMMTVCVGSDDPGIFVSDLKNEYYHIFANLMQSGQTPARCMEYIRQLNEAGRIYGFQQPIPRLENRRCGF